MTPHPVVHVVSLACRQHEGESRDLQSFAGHLIYELSGEELEEVLLRLLRLENRSIEDGLEDLEQVYGCLSLIGGVSLSSEGRKIICEREGVIQKLLDLCHCAVTEVVRLSLTALERLARELEYGTVINDQGGMVSKKQFHGHLFSHRTNHQVFLCICNKQDKAAVVLKRSADNDSIDPEVSAAATSLMARLTETSILLNNRGLNRSGSQQEAKLEGLQAAILAYSRHPGNILLFRSLLDLALSNLQRARIALSINAAEDGESEPTASAIDILLVRTSLDVLSNFMDRELPKAQQVIFRDKIWSDFGESYRSIAILSLACIDYRSWCGLCDSPSLSRCAWCHRLLVSW